MAAAHGLLQKARAYLDAQRRLVIISPGSDGKGMPEIREADRERILTEIEREVSGTRTPVTPELLSFTPRRRGSLLPLMVNLGAVAVMAAGIYGALWLSQRREQAAAASTATLTTAEGKLLETLKQESEERLAGKDREIADIRGKLAGLDQERERIRADADARIGAKELELEQSMAATLEAERQRLLATGLTEAAVTKRLVELEARTRAASDAELAAFRRQAEAERLAQEQAAEELRAEYQQSLSQAQSDRSRIMQEAAQRQAELEAGYRQKQLSLEQDKAAALAQLEVLRKAQEKENLVMDQFLSFYRDVKDEIAAGRPDAAASVLARFRSYLDDPSVAVLPAISRRRPVELFLIGSLEEIAKARATAAADSVASQSLVASAGLVAAVAGLVQDGEASFADKDYARAREIYLSALAKIPAVQMGVDRLAAIEAMTVEREQRAIDALFADGNAAYLAGEYDRASERYRRGLASLAADRGIADTLVTQLAQIGAIRERAAATAAAAAAPASSARDTAADEAARAELVAEIERLRAELASAAAARDEAIAARDAAISASAAAAQERNAAIVDRDRAAAEKDAAVAALAAASKGADTAVVAARDAAVAERDQAVAARDTAFAERDVAIADRESAISARDAAAARRDQAFAERDSALAERDQASADRDQALFRLATAEDRRTASLAGLAAFRARAAQAATAEQTVTPEKLASLVETKVLVQKVLLSEAVLAEYPDLADRLDSYLEALASENRGDAGLETLRDLDAGRAGLAGGNGGEVGDEILARRAATGQRELLLDILDKLKTLLE